MITTRDIDWLAGLLEGEGTFFVELGKAPLIALEMTDRDVVERAAQLLDGNVRLCTKRDGKAQTYGVRVYGAQAIGWMYTLYSVLGSRRRQQIEFCLNEWRIRPVTYKNGTKKSLFDNAATLEILRGR